jgi:hypothetical protein
MATMGRMGYFIKSFGSGLTCSETGLIGSCGPYGGSTEESLTVGDDSVTNFNKDVEKRDDQQSNPTKLSANAETPRRHK